MAAHRGDADPMMVRAASLVLLLGGLTIGSIADRPVERVPPRVAGRTVLTADLHVHAFPGDGVLPPWELRREARRRGVDVIAVTNHNHRIAARLPVGSDRGQTGVTPLVIPGQEITSPLFHMVAVGVRRVIDWRLPLRETIDAVHAQGGVAIAAHPVRDSWRPQDDDAIRTLDGTEAVHALGETYSRGRFELREFFRRARDRKPELAPIGSSDFHGSAPIGRCLTYIFVDEVSEAGVLSAIGRGHTVASDNRGTLIGDPALVKLVQGAGVETPFARQPGPWARLSVWMVLSALALLICVRDAPSAPR
jgi:hypothetical protein